MMCASCLRLVNVLYGAARDFTGGECEACRTARAQEALLAQALDPHLAAMVGAAGAP